MIHKTGSWDGSAWYYSYRGREIGGTGGGAQVSPPHFGNRGGWAPSYYHMPILQHCDIVLSYVCERVLKWKVLLDQPPKMLPECLRNAPRESKFPKFSGGACPQTPLGRLWAYAHSIIIVTVHNQRSEPPTFTICFPPLSYTQTESDVYRNTAKDLTCLQWTSCSQILFS